MELINPIATVNVALGIVLILVGLFLLVKRKKATGVVLSVTGLCIAAGPFLITALLG